MKREFDYYFGCLIGGAIGDALGRPIEFMDNQQIKAVFGEQGVTGLVIPPYLKHALVTDDTQLMMFTCEGLIRSATRARRKNKGRTDEGISIAVHRAYLRWLYTQGLRTQNWKNHDYDGWLLKVKRLYAYREPGVTCLTALGKGIKGTRENPINDSLGCGCVHRAVPVGLVEEEERVFNLGAITAAITHGNPTAYLSAGVIAYMIHCIIMGSTIKEAAEKAMLRLQQEEGHEVLLAQLKRVLTLSEEGEPDQEKIESLGKGFAAHEVLSMGIYAALAYPEDYQKAVLFAINHRGDSDSIGAITGSLVGAYLGVSKIPSEYVENVELHREIEELARDLITFYRPDEEWLEKYPAW